MDILKMILDNLTSERVEKLIPIINLLKENSFDIKKTIKGLSFEMVAPILLDLFLNGLGEKSQEEKNPSDISDGDIDFDNIKFNETNGQSEEKENENPIFSPLKKIASKKMLYNLNLLYNS